MNKQKDWCYFPNTVAKNNPTEVRSLVFIGIFTGTFLIGSVGAISFSLLFPFLAIGLALMLGATNVQIWWATLSGITGITLGWASTTAFYGGFPLWQITGISAIFIIVFYICVWLEKRRQVKRETPQD